MASKTVKTQLKTAKAAVNKKNYHEAGKICQEIFTVDERNYTAHVFAGLAASELGRVGEAKEHYKSAIAVQPTDQLAWKGLANFYDKHSPQSPDETRDAVEAYQTLISFSLSDVAKKRSALKKLALLWQQLRDTEQVVHTYSSLLQTYNASQEREGGGERGAKKEEEGEEEREVAEIWQLVIAYLLGEQVLSDAAWGMLVMSVDNVLRQPECSSNTELDIRGKFIPLLLSKYKVQLEEVSAQLLGHSLLEHCHILLQNDSTCLPALDASSYVTVVEVLEALPDEPIRDRLTQWRKNALEQLYQIRGENEEMKEIGGGEGGVRGKEKGGNRLFCVGMACLKVLDGQWKEAKTLAERGLSCSEVYLLLAYICYKLHDYKSVQEQAKTGLKMLRKLPPFLSGRVERKLKLLLAQALLSQKETAASQQALSLLTPLSQVMSCDSQVILALTRAHLALGEIDKAEEMAQQLKEGHGNKDGSSFWLEGEIQMAKKNYSQALHLLERALQLQPRNGELLLVKGVALWEMGDRASRVQAYSTLVVAAKIDPFNPDVFLYIGHYQKLFAGDTRRAIKCYQKAVDLQPAHTQALHCLGDTLFAAGEEDGAFGVYSQLTSVASAAKVGEAWLRLGLCYRKKGKFTEAINSFQSALASDINNKQCCECLAEAYLARGSYTSALKAFSKVVELNPKSVYCLYQLAHIAQLLGHLREAVSQYTAVLNLEPAYVPALKGRGHTHFRLALNSLDENFDGRAVDHVSAALSDLTRAASLRPKFLCVWKLIGDCCTCLHLVALQTARPTVPAVLVGKSGFLNETVVVKKKELFLIGCKAYEKALHLSPGCSSLWHDLSLAYIYLLEVTGSEEKLKHYVDYALNAIKKAISLSPNNHGHWNALGVIAAHQATNKPALAQHAFIKSIQLDSNNAVAWSNLGALYLQQTQMELAHKAFQAAQSQDPDYVAAWVGQAMIAHTIGHAEAMDLFRHSTGLAYHSEGSRGYAYWVCHTLSTIDRALILESDGSTLTSTARVGLLQARDSLQKYVERDVDDACALNLLGLLYEQEGLPSQAEKALSRAAFLLSENPSSDPSHMIAINANRARILSALRKPSSSLELFFSLGPPSDVSTQLQVALTLFTAQRYAESLKAYQHALTMCKEEQKSSILSAVAMVAFAQKDMNQAKTFLFQAFQAQPPCHHGLISLTLLGCLQRDFTLVQVTLQELLKILEWQGETPLFLHQSAVLALKNSVLLLESDHQAQECIEAINKTVQILPHTEPPVQSPALPLLLPSLQGSDPATILLTGQRLVHSYPTDVWSLALLTHAVELNNMNINYSHLLLQYILTMSVTSNTSSRNVTMPHGYSLKAEEDTTLLLLQRWL